MRLHARRLNKGSRENGADSQKEAEERNHKSGRVKAEHRESELGP